MRRSARLVATAAAFALVPFTSACTVTFGDDDKSAETPAASAPTTAAAQTETSPAEPAGTTETPSAPATSGEPTGATPSQTATESAGAGSDSPAPTTGNAASGGEGTVRQKVDVPTGVGIKDLELLDIYGGDTSGGKHGRAVAVFKVTTDRPMLINLRLQLFDAAGKEIASNDGLNPAYTTGTHYLVTSSLIELPTGARPEKFKVSLIDTTDMSEPTFTRFDKPRVEMKGGIPNLVGSFGYTGTMRSSMDSRGACVLPNGKIYAGQEGLTDNPTTAFGGTATGEYSIPLYDAKGEDLSKARCYASV